MCHTTRCCSLFAQELFTECNDPNCTVDVLAVIILLTFQINTFANFAFTRIAIAVNVEQFSSVVCESKLPAVLIGKSIAVRMAILAKCCNGILTKACFEFLNSVYVLFLCYTLSGIRKNGSTFYIGIGWVHNGR